MRRRSCSTKGCDRFGVARFAIFQMRVFANASCPRRLRRRISIPADSIESATPLDASDLHKREVSAVTYREPSPEDLLFINELTLEDFADRFDHIRLPEDRPATTEEVEHSVSQFLAALDRR